MSHMKTTTVRELRNNNAQVLHWVAGGEEVTVTRRGKVVAKVVPVAPPKTRLDWTRSAAFARPAWSRVLTAAESASILHDSQGG